MEKYLYWAMIIIIINILLLFGCDSVKRKATSDLQIDIDIYQCEVDHFKAYVRNKEFFRYWSELKLDGAKKICEDYLQKFFPKTVFKTLEASIKKVHVHYKQMINVNIKQIRVTALECFNIFGVGNSRQYYHFIRAPKDGCVYLLNRVGTSKKMHIIIELCDSDTTNSLKASGKLRKALSSVRRICPSEYDDEKLRGNHEKEHLKDYWLHKDLYSRWPERELGDKGADEYCQIFIKKLYPKSALSGIKSEPIIISLVYVIIVDNKGSKYLPVNVSALRCTLPDFSKKQRTYQFTKAPVFGSSKCAYWVNKDKKLCVCRITKKICE